MMTLLLTRNLFFCEKRDEGFFDDVIDGYEVIKKSGDYKMKEIKRVIVQPEDQQEGFV